MTIDYWSYSSGANYLLTDNLAVFARVSRGSRANADRLVVRAGRLHDHRGAAR